MTLARLEMDGALRSVLPRHKAGGAGAGWAKAWQAELREELGDDLFAAAHELASCVTGSGDEQRGVVLALAAACLSAARSGSTRVPIGALTSGPLSEMLAALRVPDFIARRVFALLAADPAERGGAGSLLGRRDEQGQLAFVPLIEDNGAISTHRLVSQEDAIGRRLRARLSGDLVPYRADAVRAALLDLARRPPVLASTKAGSPSKVIALSDEQVRAVVAAAHQPLTVISGGPGTGKTSIVVSILRLLLRLGTRCESIALAAPTGKAANRMDESISTYLERIANPDACDASLLSLRPTPMTVHRLLGYSPARDQFRHHAGNPLPYEVVIIDEASMLDLAMMDQLLQAVSDPALRQRIILLGDAEQLPSVDAGAVLRDLVPPMAARPQRPWDVLFPAELVGTGAEKDLRAQGALRLTKSYRMDQTDPAGRNIYEVSLVIRAGRVPDVVGLATDKAHLLARPDAHAVTFASVELMMGEEKEREAFFHRWFWERVAAQKDFEGQVTRTWQMQGTSFAPPEVAAMSELDGQLQRSRLLCLTKSRQRPSGAARVNQVLSDHLAELTGEDGEEQTGLRAGTPIVMTKNDYQLELFNGDPGVVLWVKREGEAGRQLRMVFQVKGTYQVFDSGMLGPLVEPCWAMTVHKAQGSEFDAVALVLPTEAERKAGGEAEKLACREVVYTAMTRARHSVTVLGSVAALTDAVGRSIERWSALGRERFWTS